MPDAQDERQRLIARERAFNWFPDNWSYEPWLSIARTQFEDLSCKDDEWP